jgi:PKHD-type hydroxylase
MELKPVFFNKSVSSLIQYYTFAEAFTEEQLNWINNLKNLFPIEKANTTGPTEDSVRNSHIRWIDYNEKSAWLYKHLSELIQTANNEMWNFDISYIDDSIQYTEYHDNGGHYDWHLDVGMYPVNHRKISVTIQLSDPDDYEGGDFEVMTSSIPDIAPRKKGCAILFPSYLLHRVTPVTKGIRKSLVIWVNGQPLK